MGPGLRLLASVIAAQPQEVVRGLLQLVCGRVACAVAAGDVRRLLAGQSDGLGL